VGFDDLEISLAEIIKSHSYDVAKVCQDIKQL
jgi:hypothetical protein